jgi:hypothetical protein
MFERRYLTPHAAFSLSFDQFSKLKCELIHKMKHYDTKCPMPHFANQPF